MKNLKVKGVKILSKTTQKSIGGGDINLPDPIIECWEWVCTIVGFPPLTARYCRWEKRPGPC